MAEWEDRLSLIDELLPDWMKQKKISETTPNDCYDFLVEKEVYKNNKIKGKSLRDDLRKLQKKDKHPIELNNLIIIHESWHKKWRIQLSNDSFPNMSIPFYSEIKPFTDEDYLERKKVAEKFSAIILNDSIKNKDHQGLVVALDSAWGTGKTYFIRKWQLMLGEEFENYKIRSVYYNAWENDDYESALIPLISEIYNCSSTKVRREIAKKAAKVIVAILGVTGRQLIRNNLKIETKEYAEEIEKAIKDSIFKDYREHQKNKRDFKKTLSELSNKNEKIVVFIDELDRCRPQFAIETLEAIKHFMNVNNFIFIFAIDMEQLSHSVATMYGQNMDASGYLARFFDIQFRLPTPKISRYLKLLTNGFEEESEKDVNSIIEDIFNPLQLSLRDINHIYDNLSIFLGIYSISRNYTCNKLEVYTFLIALKYKYPEILQTIFYRRFADKEALNNHPITLFGKNRIIILNGAIEKFIVWCENDGMQSTVEFEGKGKESFFNNYLAIDNDYYLLGVDEKGNEVPSEKISEYVERKLEFIDYIKKENK